MNKMERRELVNITSKERHNVSFFEDDTIETVREQVATSANSHPDRMYILVSVKFPKDYYKSDPRTWTGLFHRLSYNGRTIEKSVFEEYQTNYRFPNTKVAFEPYTIEEWSEYPSKLKELFAPASTFAEYRILGVAELKSFIMPLNGDSKFLSRIPAVEIPVPQNTTLLSSLYSVKNIDHFAYKIYDQEVEEAGVTYFYPLLRSITPATLSDESVNILHKNSKLVSDILSLKLPKDAQHNDIHILSTKFYIPWVDTDFGSAVRTRFEQMFYGLTVSQDVPYISLFTSNDEINRHKFFTEDAKTKKPYLDMQMWKSWSSTTKPRRNRPTLILYRGTSKNSFDRIAITSVDMTIITERPRTCTQTIDEIKADCEKWLHKFDAIIPFVDLKDIHLNRWELQDMMIHMTYNTPINELSLLRFNCISPIFAVKNKEQSEFTLLRTDHSNFGITSVEAKLVQMSQEGPLDVNTVAKEFSITNEHASTLIQDVFARREENNKLGDRLFRNYPKLTIGPKFVTIEYIKETELCTIYADFLRYILSNPDSKDLDSICPPRMQTIAAESAVISTQAIDEDAVITDAFADLLEDYYDMEAEEVPVEKPEEPTKKTSISVANQRTTVYNYFHDKLRSFDPDTFVEKSDYASKCDLKLQPVVFTPDDKKRLKSFEDGKYDAVSTAPKEKIMELDDPTGTLLCPEYWCMKDEIPLREDQLLSEDDTLKCPVCHGKLQTSTSLDAREYPLIKRITGANFPGLKDYQSPGNGKNMPCCYKKARTIKTDKSVEIKDKYYAFKDDKRLPEFRMAKLSTELIRMLGLLETYKSLDNQRISENSSGFFRVGLGHASTNLPTFLGLSQVIPSPRESVQTVLKCSFLRMWTKKSDTHSAEIYTKLKDHPNESTRKNLAELISGIDDAFHNKELSPIEDLEYSALALQCDVFRINISNNTVGCVLHSSMIKSSTRAIVALQRNEDIDILSKARRSKNKFTYQSNVFEDPPFRKFIPRLLGVMRTEACTTEIPNYTQALKVKKVLFGEDKYSVILDPYGRGQALYIPDKMVLPFNSSPIPDSEDTRLWGYEDVDRLPSFAETKELLKKAETITVGYKFEDGLYDSAGRRVEIVTTSGLRVPIKPEKVGTGQVADTIETVKEVGEDQLVFGETDKDMKGVSDNISYESEVFEFLMFQLSNDLQHADYKNLRDALRTHPPVRKTLEPLLRKWFDAIVRFVDVKSTTGFVSKIRTPCGQFAKKDCKGNLCGWDGKVCSIQVKKSVNEDKLFGRLFSSVFDNSKIRAVVLDGRTTPFFSTILYIQLPHEYIVTDKELPV